MLKLHASILIIGLLACCSFAISAKQSDYLEQRVSGLESVRSDARIAAVEARLDNIENINIGIFGGVLVQLLLTSLYHTQNRRSLKRQDQDYDH